MTSDVNSDDLVALLRAAAAENDMGPSAYATIHIARNLVERAANELERLTPKPVLFNPGQKVWWNIGCFAYGWEKRVPAEFIELSRTGKRALIRYTSANGNGKWSSRVTLGKLEPRE